jgi:hypothetical protein
MGAIPIEFGGLTEVLIEWRWPIEWQTGVADSMPSASPRAQHLEPIRAGVDDLVAAEKPFRPQPTDKAVRSWMRDRVETWPDDRPAPTEQDDVAAAQEYFAPGLSRDELRTVRDVETPEAWRKQGPRRSWGIVKKSAA